MQGNRNIWWAFTLNASTKPVGTMQSKQLGLNQASFALACGINTSGTRYVISKYLEFRIFTFSCFKEINF